MAASQSSLVRSCADLSHGDEIEAWRFGELLHRGRVSQTLPSAEMFWIICSRTGTRKLVEIEATDILRTAAARGSAAAEALPVEGLFKHA